MKRAKVCLALEWSNIDYSHNLDIIKNIIRSFNKGELDYLAIDMYKSNIRRPLDLDQIDDLCREREISWFPIASSIRDINSTRPYYSKFPENHFGFMIGISSENIKDTILLEHAKACSDYLVLYTGGCKQSDIDRAIEIAQPDLVIHHSIGDIRLDYLKYLQGISMEFEKKYIVGFKNTVGSNPSLLLGASMLDAKFLEYTIEIGETLARHYRDDTKAFDNILDLTNNLECLATSRGGYEARKLSKAEKEANKK
jgi:hypothetical protein